MSEKSTVQPPTATVQPITTTVQRPRDAAVQPGAPDYRSGKSVPAGKAIAAPNSPPLSTSSSSSSIAGKRRSMASPPPPPPPRSRTISPLPDESSFYAQQSRHSLQSQSDSPQQKFTAQTDQKQVKTEASKAVLVNDTSTVSDVRNDSKQSHGSEPSVDQIDTAESKREKLKREIEQQLKLRHQQFVQQQQQELIDQQKKNDEAEEKQKQKELAMKSSKSQSEQLREELQQRLQLRQQQLQQSENKQKSERQQMKQQMEQASLQKLTQNQSHPTTLPLKKKNGMPPAPPRRKSSLPRATSPLFASLSSLSASTSPVSSSRDFTRSPSPPPPPPPPPPRSSSTPPSPPPPPPLDAGSPLQSRATVSMSSSLLSSPTSPQRPTFDATASSLQSDSFLSKVKGLPQVIPPGIPPPLKKTQSIVKSGDKIHNEVNYSQISRNESDILRITSRNVTENSAVHAGAFNVSLRPRPKDTSEEEDKSSMSISWPIQPVPKDSFSPAAQVGEVVRISSNNPFASGSNSSSLGISQSFDPNNRCFSPVNSYPHETKQTKPTFRSFSPVSFTVTEQTYCEPGQIFPQKHHGFITNPMNQLSSGTGNFKSNPGMAHRVCGSNQDITDEGPTYSRPYEVNVSESQRSLDYLKNGIKSGSSDIGGDMTRSSETNELLEIIRQGTNDLKGSIKSLENNDFREVYKSHDLNIKNNSSRSDLNIKDMNIKGSSDIGSVSDINTKDLNIPPDSSSDNGNDNTAADMDQTSDSIQMDACESVDSVGGPQIRCRNPTCGKFADTEELRILFKSCHNCATPYCSRVCRRSHWEKHKKICQKIRANNAAREIVAMVRDKEISLDAASAVGRRGALGLGRGVVKMFFPDIPSAESFIEGNYTPSMHYHTAQNLMPNEMCPEVYRQLMEMCRMYNSDHKFILYVSICVNSEITSGPSKCKRENVSRAAKIRLFDPMKRMVTNKQPTTTFRDETKDSKVGGSETGVRLLTFTPNQKDISAACTDRENIASGVNLYHKSSSTVSKDREQIKQVVSNQSDALETLILTPVEPLNVSARESRQIAFHNILRHLRERNILLRTQYPDVYRKLSIYADVGETFPPLTIYPKDADTGETLICVIMPETDQNKIRKLASETKRLRKIDITKPPQNVSDSKRC